MPLTKEQKQKVVEKIRENLGKQKILIFVGIAGLKAKEMFDLRRKLKENNCLLLVVKKTLFKIASQEEKLPIEIRDLKGEVALVFGFRDEISAAKIIYKFSLDNESLKILGGVLENQFINEEKVVALAKIPSKEELLAKIVGTIKSPIANFVNVLEGNIRNLVYVLSIIKK